MGRVKCFKCGQSGHIGTNCQASSPKSASSSPSSSTGKVQVQPRPSLQRKLDEEKVVARERCMKFQPKDLRFQVQRELGGC